MAKKPIEFLSVTVLHQAGINGATCMMILHKITFSMIQNIAYNQFLSTLT